MPITSQTAPPENVEQLAGVASGPVAADDHSNLIPHRVFELSLAEIAQGKHLEDAQLAGWRYLIEGEDGLVHAAEVGTADDDSHAFQGHDRGRHVEDFHATYQELHEHELVAQHDYAVSLVRVPDLDVMAMWLRGDDHHHEMLVPLESEPTFFAAGAHYSPDRFMEIVLKIGRQRALEEDMVTAPEDEEHQPGPEDGGDDLTRLAGIDAQMAEALRARGLTTYVGLLEAGPDAIVEFMEELGVAERLEDPRLLLQQAEMAAAGDWDSLREMQGWLREELGLD